MSIWQNLLLEPLYASDLAVDATFIRTTGERHSVRAMDLTEGQSVPGSSFVDMQTLKPAASVMRKSIIDLGVTDLKEYFYKGELIINGKRWRVKSYQLAPSPAGLGEILILLSDEQAP